MTDLSQIEARIVELCERARDELGWRFASFPLSNEVDCGCALQASGAVLECDWKAAGRELGVMPVSFGVGFDHAARGIYPQEYPCDEAQQRSYDLGARIARRFVEGVG